MPDLVGTLPQPQRIQLRRSAGWRKPAGAVVVARPSRYGNPYRLARVPSCRVAPTLASQWRNGIHWHVLWPDGGSWCYPTRDEAAARAVELYRMRLVGHPLSAGQTAQLHGRDLACWCPLDQPCHADVLLDLLAVPT